VHHLCAGVSLLHIIGNGDGIELTLAIITSQNAAWIFSCYGTTLFNLRPHYFGAITAELSAFGSKVIDETFPIFIPWEPVLQGEISNFCVIHQNQLNACSVELCNIPFRSRTTFQIRLVRPFIGNYQRAFKLACVFSVDPEICRNNTFK
jgi:hypothetical protein